MLLLAAAGQLALERSRAAGARPSALAAFALIGSAILAVAALAKGDWLPGPPRPLEPPRFSRTLYLAATPGLLLLLAALFVHLARPGEATAVELWSAGLVVLLVPGVIDWYRGTRRRPTEARPYAWRFLAAAALLFLFAFAVRTWGGVEHFPRWVDSDEAATGISGRGLLSGGLSGVFGFWDMGAPNMSLAVSRLAAWPFGEGLRALRMGNALLGSLTVVLLFDFARRLIGGEAAFLAALLLAVNHAFVHYSRVGEIYVQSPFFASLVLALLVRALTGGSFLALTGAGIALGIGAATYVPAHILPPLVAVTVVGWAIVGAWPSRGLAAVLVSVLGIAALTCAPVVATVLGMSLEIAYQRVPSISLLRSDGFRQLRDAYGAASIREAVESHVLATISIFNFGRDQFKAYGADRALADAATAALVPGAFALLLARLSSAVGWVSIVFSGAYLTGGVLLCAGPPTYHRILVVLLFSSLGVAWTATGLARLIAPRGWSRRTLTAATTVVVAGTSAWLNLHYYFRELPRTRLVDASFGLANIVCRYAATHTVIDATQFEGRDYVEASRYQTFQCPEAKRVVVRKAAELRSFDLLTRADRVVVVLPSIIETASPSEPRGYRLVRRSVDTSIQFPEVLPLSILEYEREGIRPVRGDHPNPVESSPTRRVTPPQRSSPAAPSTGTPSGRGGPESSR
jgi:4-amino-4-deoxy-L-arabinose transferase-like glycosyltransferase